MPLNEIMHSVWVIWRRVPCLISSSPEDLKQKYIFHANTNTVITLDFNTPLGHTRIYFARSGLVSTASVRCQIQRVRWRTQACFYWPRGHSKNLHLCYFCPATLQCHLAYPLPAITLPSGTELMMSPFHAISQLHFLTPELVLRTY